MFKCGDKVIYKSFGVCTIEQTDYVLESMNSKGGDVPPRLYFVLKSESARGGQAFVPADKAEELIRPVIDRADAINLAQQLSEIEPETYIDKNMHTPTSTSAKSLPSTTASQACVWLAPWSIALPSKRQRDTSPRRSIFVFSMQHENRCRKSTPLRWGFPSKRPTSI